jgi:hypothetical protein
VIACVAGDTGLESDTVSDGEALDIASALYQDSCGLVAQCYGVFDDVSPYSAVLPVVDLCGEDFVSLRCIEQIEMVEGRENGKKSKPFRLHLNHRDLLP